MLDFDLNELKGESVSRIIGKTIDVPIDIINPDPANLREVFDIDDIKDLGLNMLRVGQLDEITLFPKQDHAGQWTGEFDLHDGERRWRAAKMVEISLLRAKIIERPERIELLLKKTSRVLQTRVLEPEKKIKAVEKTLKELGVWEKPETWESYREQLGGGAEWPQIIRVIGAKPIIREMLNEGAVNFTLAQSIGRLPLDKQEEAAKYVVANKISGRFFSTEMVPYLLENPSASLAQAFENARVGGWRQYMKSPYKRGEEPPTEEQLEDFLEACIKWERAWEIVVHTGLIFKIIGNTDYESRIKAALNRLIDRTQATLDRIESGDAASTAVLRVIQDQKLLGDSSKKDPT